MTLKLWLEHLGLELPPASTLSDNLNAVSNQTRTRHKQCKWIEYMTSDHRVAGRAMPGVNQVP